MAFKLVFNKNDFELLAGIANRIWILWISVAFILFALAAVCVPLLADVTLLTFLKVGILTKVLGIELGLWLVIHVAGVVLCLIGWHKKNGLDSIGKAVIIITMLIAIQTFVYSLCLTFGINNGWPKRGIFNLYLVAMPIAVIVIGLFAKSSLNGTSRISILIGYIVMSCFIYGVSRYDQSLAPQIFNRQTGESNIWKDPINGQAYYRPDIDWGGNTGVVLVHVTDREEAIRLGEELFKSMTAADKRTDKPQSRAGLKQVVPNQHQQLSDESSGLLYLLETEIPVKTFGDFKAMATKQGSPTFVIEVDGPFRYHFHSPYALGVEFEGGPIQVFQPNEKKDYVNPNRRLILHHKGPGEKQMVTVSIIKVET